MHTIIHNNIYILFIYGPVGLEEWILSSYIGYTLFFTSVESCIPVLLHV